MQLTTPKGKFVEKVLRDSSGRLVRVAFCVYENNGRIKARLLNAVYLEENKSIQNRVLKLETVVRKQIEKIGVFFQYKTISPYYSLNQLYFLGSKPRAPTDKFLVYKFPIFNYLI